MTLLASHTLAASQAQDNLNANLAALDQTQPDLRQWVIDQVLNVEWVFGRDRTLTAIDEFGQWHSGSSLPGRTARALLSKLEIKGAVACFLCPSHAAQIGTALERLRPEQAIIAVVPEHRDLAMILHSADFSESIQSHRLWLAAGPAWDVGLRSLLERLAGLATPTQFIRTPLADPQQTQELIATAQQIFADISASRSEQLQSFAGSNTAITPAHDRLCVVAPSRFRLWNDLGHTMIGALADTDSVEVVPFDPDDPLCSSPLALATTVRRCTALLTANTARSDLPGLIPETIPWITWLTAGRIPSSALAGERDHLLAVDSSIMQAAIRAGWKATHVHLATWPALPSIQPAASRGLSIIADTSSLDTPRDLIEYSSHCVLWESIRHELLDDPTVVHDVASYLKQRMQRSRVGEEGFSAARFIEKLIVPAYQQGLARLLIRAKIPLALYGSGWESIPEFAAHASGPVGSREDLANALARSAALVHAWPSLLAHPIESAGLPLLRRGSGGPESLVRQARHLLQTSTKPVERSGEPLSGGRIRALLRSTSA